MTAALEFTAVVDQNEYLFQGEREVEALVSVAAKGREGEVEPDQPPRAAAVLIIDRSGSMEMPRQKLDKAKEAAAAAIDQLRDGVAFAIVAGNEAGEVFWPPEGRLLPADSGTRAAAKEALRGLRVAGGTAIGQWLKVANHLFTDCSDAICHAILLTDGQNQHETPEQLLELLGQCEGRFTCDCRGVGDDWVVDELRTISSTLLGTLRMVPEPAGLAEDFRTAMEAAMQNTVPDVRLRISTPDGAKVRFVKQAYPTIEELTDRCVQSGPRSGDYPTGSWRAESRDYHVAIDVEPGEVGDEMLAGRVQLVVPRADGGERIAGQGLVRAVWTDDAAESTPIPPSLALAQGQEELAQLIQKGVDALDHDDDTATALLGQARSKAVDLGVQPKVDQIDRLVDFDEETGTFELRVDIARRDKMWVDVESSTTAPPPLENVTGPEIEE